MHAMRASEASTIDHVTELDVDQSSEAIVAESHTPLGIATIMITAGNI
jgi:hypothetical protein